MDVGDGITVQTAVVNGKTAPKIILMGHSNRTSYSKNKPSGLHVKHLQKNKKENQQNSNNKHDVQAGKQKEKRRGLRHVDIVDKSLSPLAHTEASSYEKPKALKQSKLKISSDGPQHKPNHATIEVDTHYVTLTQDQLNSILNLVKVNQSATHLETSGEIANTSSQTLNELQEDLSEPTLESVGDQNKVTNNDENSNFTSETTTNKENETKQEENNGIDKDLFPLSHKPGTILGFGLRDQDQLSIEKKKQKWLQELNAQIESKKDTLDTKKGTEGAPNQTDVASTLLASSNELLRSFPSSMRSSFFFGESPRDRAYRAKKKDEQKSWKEELEKQINDKNQAKTGQKNKLTDGKLDDSAWTKHFDTFLPNPKRKPSDLDMGNDATPIQGNLVPRSPEKNDLLSTAKSDRSNYLRSMTSLLDPAEIDAIELRRLKQEEHRRAISEQVNAKRKLKEAEDKARKYEEEMEEKRLIADRLKLKAQLEREKNLQLVKEEKREQQTIKVYQQIKDAEAHARKDKMERKKHNLHLNGHDTSRLEKKYLETLNKNSTQPTKTDAVHTSTKQQEVTLHSKTDPNVESSISMHAENHFVTYQTDPSGKLKLEISLLQSPRNLHLTEAAVQTETIPIKTDNVVGKDTIGNKLSSFVENKHHEKPKHQEISLAPRAPEKKTKPKWGVGQKKTYLSASQRYTGNQQTQQIRSKTKKANILNQQTGSHHAKDKKVDNTRKNTSSNYETSISILENSSQNQAAHEWERKRTAMSVTTDEAKYESSKHSSSSPVPETLAFVEYRRSDSILNVNAQLSQNVIPNTNMLDDMRPKRNLDMEEVHSSHDAKFPFLDGNLKQQQRQEKILHEISILRQGLLLKQREVASYPVTVGRTLSSNLTEKHNEPIV